MNPCITCKAFKYCFASSLTKSELSDLKDKLSIREFKEGDIIYRENNSANHIYMILDGEIKLEHEDDLIRPVIMRIAHELEYLGLESIVRGKKYLMTAIATTDARICAIPLSFIEHLFEVNKRVCSIMLTEVQKDLEHIFKYALLIISGSSLSKISYALLTLSDKNGNISSLKEEIALMTGLRRETVSRILSKLKASHIIEINKRKIKIINFKELEKIRNDTKQTLK